MFTSGTFFIPERQVKFPHISTLLQNFVKDIIDKINMLVSLILI